VQAHEREALRRDLGRLADGDRSAFDAVFAAALPLVRNLARRMVGPSDADDAAQEALIKVFSRASDFDSRRDALTWVMAIASYECRTIRRRRQRRRDLPLEHAPDRRTDTPEEQLLDREILRALDEILGGLSQADVAAIAAALEGGRAGALGVTAPTFRKRLQRALSRFRAAWQERESHGE
jgi:RNA polymerase sigma factor (sigma-70 family)